MTMTDIVVLCDPVTGEPVTSVDADDSCQPYYPSDKCGGCGRCQLEQGLHVGMVPHGPEYEIGWEFGELLRGQCRVHFLGMRCVLPKHDGEEHVLSDGRPFTTRWPDDDYRGHR
jgi:hypothetical protein